MSGGGEKVRKPPATVTQSRQLELFQNFYGGDGDYSNTAEMWDSIPRHSVTARRSCRRVDRSLMT